METSLLGGLRRLRLAAPALGLLLAFGVAAGECPRDTLKLNEIAFAGGGELTPYLEFVNTGEASVDARGVELVWKGGSFTVPATLTALVPPGGYVVVSFDGLDAAMDDLSFAEDNFAVLHAPEGSGPAGVDYVQFYRAAGVRAAQLLIDFVAWGEAPGAAAEGAVAQGLWPAEGTFVAYTTNGLARGPGAREVGDNEALQRLAGFWGFYPLLTPGAPADPRALNPVPVFPSEGLVAADFPEKFWWSAVPGAIGYEVEIATTADFASVALTLTGEVATVDVTAPLPTDAAYFWRVRANYDGSKGPFSAPVAFTCGFPPLPPEPPLEGEAAALSKPAVDGPFTVAGIVRDAESNNPMRNVVVTIDGKNSTTNQWGRFIIRNLGNGTYPVTAVLAGYTFAPGNVTVAGATQLNFNFTGSPAGATVLRGGAGVPQLPARKQTGMLAVVRGATSSQMPNFDNSRNQGWNVPHTHALIRDNDLESWWCWATTSTMLNRYFGGTITIDEVVHEVKGTLAHDRDAGASWVQEQQALRWALGLADNTAFTFYNGAGGVPLTEALLRGHLDANEPLYFTNASHVMVCDAYRFRNGTLQVRLVNPSNNGGSGWFDFATYPTTDVIRVDPAAAAAAPRATNPGVATDTDADGVVDFDETSRFGSNPELADSDADGLSDFAEIRGYVFPRGAPNGGNVAGQAFLNPDVDGDGILPQNDPDTDNGGILDGQEDLNANGLYEPDVMVADKSETDVFARGDDGVLDFCFVVDTTGSMGGEINNVKANLSTIVTNISTNFTNYRFSLVEYRDYPPEDNLPKRVITPFTTDPATIQAGINTLFASGGGDFPESMYSGIVAGLDETGGWRPEAKRVMIVLADAPPQDPEPVTGFTLDAIIARLNAGGLLFAAPPVSAPARPTPLAKPAAEGDTLSGNVLLFGLLARNDSSTRSVFTAMAEGTGGELLTATGALLTPAILEVVDTVAGAPLAELVLTPIGSDALLGAMEIRADLSGSFDPEGCGIVQYEWDWDGDGTFDETTFVPVATHTYGEGGFGGNLRARITTFTGATALATFSTLVTVVDPRIDASSEIVLNRQTGLFEQTVTVTNPGSTTYTAVRVLLSGLPAGVVVYNASGTEGGVPFVRFDQDLGPGESVTFVVEYYVPNRSTPTVSLTAEITERTTTTAPAGATFAVSRVAALEDGSILIEFPSVSGQRYAVQYSDDGGTNWRTAFPQITAAGTRTQWLDDGPPKTESRPETVSSRLYRVVGPIAP